MLDFREMKGAHSGVNMAESIFDSLTEMGILKKVLYLLAGLSDDRLTDRTNSLSHSPPIMQAITAH